MSIKDYAGYESYEQMLRHAEHHGGGVDLDYDGVEWMVGMLYEIDSLKNKALQLEKTYGSLRVLVSDIEDSF